MERVIFVIWYRILTMEEPALGRPSASQMEPTQQESKEAPPRPAPDSKLAVSPPEQTQTPAETAPAATEEAGGAAAAPAAEPTPVEQPQPVTVAQPEQVPPASSEHEPDDQKEGQNDEQREKDDEKEKAKLLDGKLRIT